MKILIIGPSWIGDIVMSQVLFSLLIQRKYKVYIDVIATSYCDAVLKYMPEIKNIIISPLKHGMLALGKRYEMGNLLKKKKYQQVFILPNSFKSALIPFFAKIPIRTGWFGEMRYGLINDIRILNKKNFPLMIHRYAALAYDKNKMHNANDLPKILPWPKLLVNNNEIKNTLTFFNLKTDSKFIGLCPDTAQSIIKRWPHYHYITLGKNLIIRGYKILLFGSITNNEIGKFIKQVLPIHLQENCFDLIGKTSLDQVIHLMTICKGIISNDSGLMHIASALSLPLVALYGSSNPYFTPPLSNKSVVITLNKSNKYKIKRKFLKIKRYDPYLINLHPNEVLKILEKLIILHN